MHKLPMFHYGRNFTTSVGSRAHCWPPSYTDFSLFILLLLTSSLENMITTTFTRGHRLTTNANTCLIGCLHSLPILVTFLIVMSDDWYFVGLGFPLFLVQHQRKCKPHISVATLSDVMYFPTRNPSWCCHNKVISWKRVSWSEYVWSWFLKFGQP